jgi:hypothetical protein
MMPFIDYLEISFQLQNFFWGDFFQLKEISGKIKSGQKALKGLGWPVKPGNGTVFELSEPSQNNPPNYIIPNN